MKENKLENLRTEIDNLDQKITGAYHFARKTCKRGS